MRARIRVSGGLVRSSNTGPGQTYGPDLRVRGELEYHLRRMGSAWGRGGLSRLWVTHSVDGKEEALQARELGGREAVESDVFVEDRAVRIRVLLHRIWTNMSN